MWRCDSKRTIHDPFLPLNPGLAQPARDLRARNDDASSSESPTLAFRKSAHTGSGPLAPAAASQLNHTCLPRIHIWNFVRCIAIIMNVWNWKSHNKKGAILLPVGNPSSGVYITGIPSQFAKARTNRGKQLRQVKMKRF